MSLFPSPLKSCNAARRRGGIGTCTCVVPVRSELVRLRAKIVTLHQYAVDPYGETVIVLVVGVSFCCGEMGRDSSPVSPSNHWYFTGFVPGVPLPSTLGSMLTIFTPNWTG